jgi:hypothetical protein
MARKGESLSRAATQGAEKGVCRFGDSFARGGSFAVSSGSEGEIFLFETGAIGIVHLNGLEVGISKGFS